MEAIPRGRRMSGGLSPGAKKRRGSLLERVLHIDAKPRPQLQSQESSRSSIRHLRPGMTWSRYVQRVSGPLRRACR